MAHRNQLSTTLGWDDDRDHLCLAIDAHGHMHLYGNMNVDQLVVSRTAHALDTASLERVDRMTGNSL